MTAKEGGYSFLKYVSCLIKENATFDMLHWSLVTKIKSECLLNYKCALTTSVVLFVNCETLVRDRFGFLDYY